MFRAIVGTLALCAATLAHAEPALCKVAPDESPLGLSYSFKVAGKGRLHFHSAPNDACIDKKVFVIPGDALDAAGVAGPNAEWVSVTYYPKDADMVNGWVRSNRLMFTGASGTNMTDAKHNYLTKAAAAAKAGKLGMP